jgi:hypothetical protein
MLVNRQQHDLARAIAKISKLNESTVHDLISVEMTMFLAGIAQPMSNRAMYVIAINPLNKWLKTQSQDAIDAAIGLHGQMSASPTMLCGKALKHFGQFFDTKELMINAHHNIFNCSARDPRRKTFDPLFYVSSAAIMISHSTDSEAQIVKKSLAGLTAKSNESLLYRKVSSMRVESIHRLTDGKSEYLKELSVSPSAKHSYKQWLPILPTANGACKHIQGFLRDVFEVPVKLSEIQNAIGNCFSTTWNHIVSNENKHTPEVIFNIMGISLSYGRRRVEKTFIHTPIDAYVAFLKEAQCEEVFNIAWDQVDSGMPVIKANIPGDDEVPIGLKYTTNIDLITTEDDILDYRAKWLEIEFRSPFDFDALGESDEFSADGIFGVTT